jgi:Ca-activated chloride channel family protein
MTSPRWLPLAALLVLGVLVTAQENQFRIRTDLVVLHVSVRDRRGAYVGDLDERAFRVYEDGQPRAVSLFRREDEPATIGLVVDSSASMFAVRPLVIAASAAFAEASHPGDEFFALTFGEGVKTALPASRPFTSDAAELRDALALAFDPHGRTPLFDAISEAIDYSARGSRARTALVVVSDGGDNASRTTFSQLAAKVQTSNVLLYSVALVDPVDEDARPELLRELSRATGGEAFEPKAAAEVHTVLQTVARDLRHAYVLGYEPISVADGRLRKLRVTVTAPGRSGLSVRTRSAYLAWPSPVAR